jgi:hypothetical protein
MATQATIQLTLNQESYYRLVHGMPGPVSRQAQDTLRLEKGGARRVVEFDRLAVQHLATGLDGLIATLVLDGDDPKDVRKLTSLRTLAERAISQGVV